MNDTTIIQQLMWLVRQGLGQAQHGQDFAIEEKDWPLVMLMSNAQRVPGLVCTAISNLPEGSVPEEVLEYCGKMTDTIRERSVKVRDTAMELISILKNSGVEAMLMKGPVSASFYPDPDIRVPGDIDLYVKGLSLDTVRQCLSPFGCSCDSFPDGSIRTSFKGVALDFHPGYFDLLPGSAGYLPAADSPEAVLLMLSLHTLKHAMGLGVGLRQICDMAMAYRSLDGRYDKEALLSCFRASGTLRWNRMLSSFMLKHLNFDAGLFSKEGLPDCSSLERIVFGAGEFGSASFSRAEALEQSARRRKTSTARQLLSNAPFALGCAPGRYFHLLAELLSGNMLKGRHAAGRMSEAIKHRLWMMTYAPLYRFRYRKDRERRRSLNILPSGRTISYILLERCSVARFGDGEFQIIENYLKKGTEADFNVDSFQNYDEQLGRRLLEVLTSCNAPGGECLICIPYPFADSGVYSGYERIFFEREWLTRRELLSFSIREGVLLGDACFSRFYLHRKDFNGASDYLEGLRKIWKDRDIVTVEGECTGLGVGNDLFSGAKSIRRIICPATDAFRRYRSILDCCEKMDRDCLFLLSLGQTATVLAYDLSVKGYQALDIGHLDIEYEWYLMNAGEKVPVNGKYVNEAKGGRIRNSVEDERYLSEVICRI